MHLICNVMIDIAFVKHLKMAVGFLTGFVNGGSHVTSLLQYTQDRSDLLDTSFQHRAE